MTNVDVVKQCYENFRKGNVPGLLALWDANIEFRLAQGHPYAVEGKPWIGVEEITREFFMKAGTQFDNWNIVISAIVEANDAVVVECRYDAFYKPTAKKLDAQACHVWRLKDGKVTSFHQYLDTARLQTVMGYSG